MTQCLVFAAWSSADIGSSVMDIPSAQTECRHNNPKLALPAAAIGERSRISDVGSFTADDSTGSDLGAAGVEWVVIEGVTQSSKACTVARCCFTFSSSSRSIAN